MKRIICIFLAILAPAGLLFADGTGLHVVVIDAGHGGKDVGCQSADRKTYEKTLVLEIANSLAERIREGFPDVKVVMTRSDDRYITLNDRAEKANKADADLFISIHINATEKNAPNGYSVHVLGQSSQKNRDLFAYNMDVCRRENAVITLEEDYTAKYQGFDPSDPESFIFMALMQNSHLEQSMKFAQIIGRNLKGGPIKADRGLWQDPFYVLWKTATPAVLVELGFISNPGDLAALRRKADRDELAQRLFNAFKEYKEAYDASIRLGRPEAVPVRGAGKDDAEPSGGGGDAGAEPAGSGKDAASLQPGETIYAVQFLVSSKKYAPGDPVFMGYESLELPAGNLRKYFVCPSDDIGNPGAALVKIRKSFPDAFLVKIKDRSEEVV